MPQLAISPATSSGSSSWRTSGLLSRRVSALLSARNVGTASSTPGAGHRLGIVQRQRSGGEQKLDQRLALSELDHLREGRVDGVSQRLGPQDILRGLDLGDIHLERRLASRGRSHDGQYSELSKYR